MFAQGEGLLTLCADATPNLVVSSELAMPASVGLAEHLRGAGRGDPSSQGCAVRWVVILTSLDAKTAMQDPDRGSASVEPPTSSSVPDRSGDNLVALVATETGVAYAMRKLWRRCAL